MNHITDWIERFNQLQTWLPDNLDIIPMLGETAESVRLAAKAGFSLLRERCDEFGPETWSTTWWLSQTLKKFRGESEIAADVRAANAITGFLSRNIAARSIRLPWWCRARARELLSAALPTPDDIQPGHFGPGAVSERVDSVERWNSLSSFRLNPRSGAFTGPRDAAWGMAPPSIARLCAVPKDVLRDRLITVEPCENSFWQQALRDTLLESIHAGPLRGTVMDMIHGGIPEVRQRRRCLRGSLTGHTSTLDLEDASDGISYVSVCDVFPAWVLYWVDLSRTTSVMDPLHKDSHELYMYAGMGNASTFMIETLYFWAVFTSIAERLHSRGLVTVFGDDIVVPSKVAAHPYFPTLCGECGIRLNLTKSVLEEGPGFREACGLAAIRGEELAPLISIKGPFSDDDVGRINLAGLITRLDHSPLWAHRLLARRLFDECDLPCIQWDRPLDGVAVILSKDLPRRGNVEMAWDTHYQRWFVRTKVLKPQQRRYVFKDLGTDLALGVLRGQLKVDTVRRKRQVRSLIKIDLAKRVRVCQGKVYLPW